MLPVFSGAVVERNQPIPCPSPGPPDADSCPRSSHHRKDSVLNRQSLACSQRMGYALKHNFRLGLVPASEGCPTRSAACGPNISAHPGWGRQYRGEELPLGLDAAARSGSPAVVEVLLDAGADTRVKEYENAQTSLDLTKTE